jgi:hypothetical protein
MIFLHVWLQIGLMWRAQFASEGWRVAPDTRGYGRSSAPTALNDYAQKQIVGEIVEFPRPSCRAPGDLGRGQSHRGCAVSAASGAEPGGSSSPSREWPFNSALSSSRSR